VIAEVKLVIAATVVALLVGAGAFAGYRWQSARVAALEADKTALVSQVKALERGRKAAEKAIAVRERARAEARAQEQASSARAREALEQNKAWADQPVPKEVQDALAR
jgi:outer membrane murein-binding lipoprotein Lpp